LPIGAGMSIFYLEVVFTIEEGGMVTMTLDMPEVKKINMLWEPVYNLYNPNEINESTTEIVILESINQKIIFEALHYLSMTGLGCVRTA
jgi:hypothetical protein